MVTDDEDGDSVVDCDVEGDVWGDNVMDCDVDDCASVEVEPMKKTEVSAEFFRCFLIAY